MNSIILLDKITHYSKILIADDSVISRMILVEICKSAGFRHIEEARNGMEAIEKIKSWKPDLVFIDMNMPQMDGLQVCHELKRLNLSSNMTIIMQTASDEPETKVQGFKAGITDFLKKPVDATEVISRAMAHLERLFLHRKLEDDYRIICDELKEASVLQKILLPNRSLLQDIKSANNVDIDCYLQPVTALGGDYLSVRKLSGNRVVLISIDISGHGLAAALYAFSVHTLLQDKMLDTKSPSEILTTLNIQLYDLTPTNRFATMFLGIIDVENGRLDYVSASAPPPILITKGKAVMLNTKGHLLGTEKNSLYETNTMPFHKGDILFLYSDALVETSDGNGDFMQEDDIIGSLLSSKSTDAASIIKTIQTSFNDNYAKNLVDDLSMLVCKL